jgi:hypothetical protein
MGLLSRLFFRYDAGYKDGMAKGLGFAAALAEAAYQDALDDCRDFATASAIEGAIRAIREEGEEDVLPPLVISRSRTDA